MESPAAFSIRRKLARVVVPITASRHCGDKMVFPSDCPDAETLDLMTKAFDAAWEEAEYALASSTFNPTGLRRLMALRIMAAVRDGEHDPERLKELALDAIAKAY